MLPNASLIVSSRDEVVSPLIMLSALSVTMVVIEGISNPLIRERLQMVNDTEKLWQEVLSKRFTKIHAFLTNGSTYLIDLFKSSIIQLWANYFAIDTSRIDLLSSLQIEFLLNGAIGMYRSLDPGTTFDQVLSHINMLIKTPLGIAIIETITGIFNTYSNTKQEAV